MRQIAGPFEHATGNHDVLFNSKRRVVVAPGVLEQGLRQEFLPAAEALVLAVPQAEVTSSIPYTPAQTELQCDSVLENKIPKTIFDLQ